MRDNVVGEHLETTRPLERIAARLVRSAPPLKAEHLADADRGHEARFSRVTFWLEQFQPSLERFQNGSRELVAKRRENAIRHVLAQETDAGWWLCTPRTECLARFDAAFEVAHAARRPYSARRIYLADAREDGPQSRRRSSPQTSA